MWVIRNYANIRSKGYQKNACLFRGNPSNLPYMFASNVFLFPFKNDPEVQTARFFLQTNFTKLEFCQFPSQKTTWGLVGARGTKHACILRNEFLMYRDFTITICLEPTQRLVIGGGICSSVLEVGIVHLRARHLDINKNDVCAHFPQRPSYTDIIYH